MPNGEIDSRETTDYRLIFEICGWATFCLATYRPGTFGDISSKDIYFPGQLLATYDNFWQFVATFDTRVATGGWTGCPRLRRPSTSTMVRSPTLKLKSWARYLRTNPNDLSVYPSSFDIIACGS